jgi:hypothetical protein
MISDNEKGLIKNDLHSLLDYLGEVAAIGCYPETQNKVNLYVTDLNIDTNFSYVFTNQMSICFVHVFDKFDIYTHDVEMAENFKQWIRLKKRSSIQISEVDDRSRIDYFAMQHQIVDRL